LSKTADHHTALGAFVDGWGRLEFGVSSLFTILAGTDSSTGVTIFRSMGMRQVIDTIMSLATRKLDDGMIEELDKLLDRLGKMNSKRNTIVHGYWTVEIVVWVYKSKVQIRGTLLREVSPPDYRIRNKISDLKNQKERIKYTFNIKRIEAATRDANTLLADIALFRTKVAQFLQVASAPPLGA
jgi:hypothetical protein